jgi:hypothetical protein
LIRGVQLALDHNLTYLVIKGDSKVIIEPASKILNGRSLERITPGWHLLGPLHSFQSLLKPSLTIITSHMRRDANRVADRLANARVDLTQQIILTNSKRPQTSTIWTHCKELAQRDYPHPDGMPLGKRRGTYGMDTWRRELLSQATTPDVFTPHGTHHEES